MRAQSASGMRKVSDGHERELLEAEQGLRRQDERPDLVQVGVGEAEGVEHGLDDRGLVSSIDGCDRCRLSGWVVRDALPEGGLGVDVGEERAGDVGEEGVEIGDGWRRDGAVSRVDLGDGVAGDGGLGDRPDEGVVLTDGGVALGGGGEALGHAGGEGEVDGEREARARAEEGAGDGVEDGGVDEAFARAEVVARQ